MSMRNRQKLPGRRSRPFERRAEVPLAELFSACRRQVGDGVKHSVMSGVLMLRDA